MMTDLFTIMPQECPFRLPYCYNVSQCRCRCALLTCKPLIALVLNLRVLSVHLRATQIQSPLQSDFPVQLSPSFPLPEPQTQPGNQPPTGHGSPASPELLPLAGGIVEGAEEEVVAVVVDVPSLLLSTSSEFSSTFSSSLLSVPELSVSVVPSLSTTAAFSTVDGA